MDVMEEFLERHREPLLRQLSGVDLTKRELDNADEADPRRFVEHVIDAYARLPLKARRSRVRATERTFWYALYTMEGLVEFPVDGQLHPFEGFLLKQLAQARELLEARAALPEGMYATRPDGR